MTRPSRPPVPPVVDLQDGDAYRVLSVRQPWAWAIIHAGKNVENRPRRSHYKGPLLIHASAAAPHEDAIAYLEQLLRRIYGGAARLPDAFPRGELVGLVDLVDCVERSRSPWADPGSFHLVLAKPRSVHAGTRLSGKLGIWNWTVGTDALGWTPKAKNAAGGVAAARPSNPRPLAAPEVACVPSEVAQVRPVSGLDSNAIIAALRAVASMTPKPEMELVTAAGRALGYRRIGSTIRDTLKAQIRVAVRRGALVKDQAGVKLTGTNVADLPADVLASAILAVLPKQGSTGRSEAARRAALRLGFTDAESATRMTRAVDVAIASGAVEAAGDGVRRVSKARAMRTSA